MNTAALDTRGLTLLVYCFLALDSPGLMAGVAQPDAQMRPVVEADWARQEQRWGRSPESAVAMREEISRAQKISAYLRDRLELQGLPASEAVLEAGQRALEQWDSLEATNRLAAYRKVRWFTRDPALRNPGVAGQPIIFMKRNRFICQMLHEYMASA